MRLANPLYRASWEGNLNKVKHLVDEKADINATSSSGETPLHAACLHNQTRVIDLLLALKANPNKATRSGISALDMATSRSNMVAVKLLIEGKADVNATRSDTALKRSRAADNKNKTHAPTATPTPTPIPIPIPAPMSAPISAPIPAPILAPIPAPIPALIPAPIPALIPAPIPALIPAPIPTPIPNHSLKEQQPKDLMDRAQICDTLKRSRAADNKNKTHAPTATPTPSLENRRPNDLIFGEQKPWLEAADSAKLLKCILESSGLENQLHNSGLTAEQLLGLKYSELCDVGDKLKLNIGTFAQLENSLRAVPGNKLGPKPKHEEKSQEATSSDEGPDENYDRPGSPDKICETTLTKEKMIGEGIQAEVFLVKWLQPLKGKRMQQYAFKCFKDPKIEIAAKEATFWTMITPHPHIAQFVAAVGRRSDGKTIGILTNYYQRGSLDDKFPIDKDQVVPGMIGLASALMHLHSLGFVHCDIALRNVLLSDEMQFILCDFGLSCVDGQDVLEYDKLPWKILSPEICNASQPIFTTSSDMWAFGVLLWELCNKQKAYTGHGKDDVLTGQVQLPLEATILPELTPVLIGCLQRDPVKRLNAKQVFCMLKEI